MGLTLIDRGEEGGNGLRGLRAAVATVGAAFTALLVAGCSAPDVACPAIAYFSTLEITVTGEVPDILELCADDVCAPSREASDVGFIVTPPAVSGQQWTFTGTFSNDLTARAYDSEGVVIADVEIAPDWQRTGGSEQCGGPMLAEVGIRI